MRTSVLFTVLAVALVVGTACKGPDDLAEDTNSYAWTARGANVVPVPAAADTLAEVVGTFNTGTGAWTASVVTAPPGTIDSIALYQVAAGANLPSTGTGATLTAGQATAILCAGAAACATGSGTATLVGTATLASIKTSMRAYGTQVVVFTTTRQYQVAGTGTPLVGGAVRGTVYAIAQ